MNFEELKLNDAILKAVKAQGYTSPSPIQEKAIPLVMEGHDVMAAAQTGTGKTAGFTLPMLHRLAQGQKVGPNQIRALILTPTRELAAQIFDNVSRYSEHLPLRANVVFGGVKINPQMQKLRRGTDILIATPGRLLDLHQQNAIRFNQLEILVLDEADRMLDMGFIHDIKKLHKQLPQKRQTLMFSATFSDDIRQLAQQFLRQPKEVSVTPSNSTAKTVTQFIYPVDKSKKAALLKHLIKDNDWSQVLVFTRTKYGANNLTKKLIASGITAAAIHGNKSQGARTTALANFKSNEIKVLVATDIAARGIDIDQLPHVINFEIPNVPEDYVHRIGRTGRAGATGEALSLVCAEEVGYLKDIEKLIGESIERVEIDGYQTIEPLPETPSNPSKPKAKRPKKKKPNRNKTNTGRSDNSGNQANRSNRQPNGNTNRPNNNPNGNRRRKPNANKTNRSEPNGNR